MTLLTGHSLNDGDEIVTDSAPGARYRVVAVHGTKAWIRELDGKGEMIVDRHRCAPARLLH